MILVTTDIAQKIFGSFGGGGSGGRLIRGRDGSSGRSGRSGRGGISSGSVGNLKPMLGAHGSPRDGRFGRRIGVTLKVNSGTPTLIAKRTSERSRTTSGHFGNITTGRLGMSMERSLNLK